EPMGRWRVPKARDGGAGAGARVAGPSTTGLRPAVPLPMTLSRHREDFERAWRSSLSAEPMGGWRVPKARDGGAGAGARVAGPSTTGLRPAVPLPVTLSRHREDLGGLRG